MANTQTVSHSERTKAIKKILGEWYGLRNVSVRAGRGTAHNWVNVKVRMRKQSKPEQKIKEEIEGLIARSGIKLSQYYTDYGRNNRYDNCLSVDIKFIQ